MPTARKACLLAVVVGLVGASSASAAIVVNPRLSAVAGVPVVCYATNAQLDADGHVTDLPDTITAGFWGRSSALKMVVIGLSPAVCTRIHDVEVGFTGNRLAQALFKFSHEITHARDLDFPFVVSHASDGWFVAQSKAISSVTGLSYADSEREAAADCVGLRRLSAVAYAVGMRGHAAFAKLVPYARGSGYVPIPKEC